jgi:hypothetical protein
MARMSHVRLYAAVGFSYWREPFEGSLASANKASNARLPLSPERAMRGRRIGGCAACARSR